MGSDRVLLNHRSCHNHRGRDRLVAARSDQGAVLECGDQRRRRRPDYRDDDGGRLEAFGNGQVHCLGVASVFRLGGNGCYGNGGGRNVRATVSVTELIGAWILLKVSFV